MRDHCLVLHLPYQATAEDALATLQECDFERSDVVEVITSALLKQGRSIPVDHVMSTTLSLTRRAAIRQLTTTNARRMYATIQTAGEGNCFRRRLP